MVALSVLSTCADGEIDGQSFLELTEPELRELLKPFKLGILKKIIRLQKEICFISVGKVNGGWEGAFYVPPVYCEGTWSRYIKVM
jgi:hypothetical protein